MTINVIKAVLQTAIEQHLDQETINALREQLATIASDFSAQQRLSLDIEQLDADIKQNVDDTVSAFTSLLDLRLKRASTELLAMNENEWERMVNEAEKA